MSQIQLIPVRGMPAVKPGDDLATLVLDALRQSDRQFREGDILVVCQKVVSKSEGRLVRYAQVSPSAMAETIANRTGKDARVVEVILQQTKRIVRMDQGHLIVETEHGWVCANAGVDESNGAEPGTLVRLTQKADASAAFLRRRLSRECGCPLAVIITDTFGRPWREGLVEVAIGAAGIAPLLDLRGTVDLNGRELHHTVVAQIDALAAAAGLLMRKGDGVPAVIVRGYAFEPSAQAATSLVRPAALDLFR